MKRVTGIGGIFFRSSNPKALGAWYRDHLGFDVTDWGGAIFEWGGPGSEKGMTIWSPFKADATHLGPGNFMINLRVADLRGLLAALKDEGCNVLDETQESAEGRFGWVFDPDGNKVELWEPPREE
jgi:catechol 2,3-dioxygenase-like lactoylglutathione lyase family enzyme